MKDTRIKNDIKVMWHILNEGAPYDIEGKDVSLYLITPFGKVKIDHFTIDKNVIHWTFFGKDQKTVGIYGLEMSINEDKEGMVTTDKCKFVRLVAHSCMVGGADEGNVETDTIELTSNLELGNGSNGDSAVFEAKFKETSYEEVKEAFEAKKVVYCYHNNRVYLLSTLASNVAYFSVILGNYHYRLAFYSSNPNPSWSEDSKNFTHSLENLDNGNAQITIAGKTAEVATPQYVENAIQQSGGGGGMTTPSGDPMHYMFEAAGATYNATDADIPMVGVYGDSYVHKAKHWHLNELGDITNEEMRRIYVAPIGDGLRWNRILTYFPHRTHLLFYYYGQTSSTSELAEATIINGLVSSKLVKFVMPPTVSNKIPTFNAPTSFAYNCKYLTAIINPFAFSTAVGAAAFGNCLKLRDIRLHNLGHSIAFKDSPEFSTASILYMVANSAATSAIVITLHADAYARAMADAEILAALEAHPNISLASA